MSSFVAGRVSCVIPCRNERLAIRRCVESLYHSDYPDLEIIVVDGMSEDGTREELAQMQREIPVLRVVDNTKRLTPYAFNLGVEAASGEFVQIVGSRNEVAQDYLSKLVNTLRARPDVACVGGDYQHVSERGVGQWISWAMESKFGVGGGNYRTMSEDCLVDTVGVPMYRHSIFSEIGYFDEQLTRNQDDEFNFRLRKRGQKILYVHTAKVAYHTRGNLRKVFRQYQQYGYFKVFVNRKHGEFTTLRQVVPALFLMFVLVGAVGVILWPQFLVGYVAVLVSYIFLGWVEGWRRSHQFRASLGVLLAFWTLHFGYGSGYLFGLYDFFVLGRGLPRTYFQQQTH